MRTVGTLKSLTLGSTKFSSRRLRRFRRALDRRARSIRFGIEREFPAVANVLYVREWLIFLRLWAYVRLFRVRWSQLELMFIHVPKTGGTSVSQVLRDEGAYETSHIRSLWELARWGPAGGPRILKLGHLESDVLVRSGLCDRDQLENVTSFAVVRDPFARAWSAYRYVNSRPGRRLPRGARFEDFVDYLLRKEYRCTLKGVFGLSHGWPQVQWLVPRLWAGPSRIFCLEESSKIEEFLGDFFGRRITLAHLNVGSGPAYPPEIFPRQEEFVEAFWPDFEFLEKNCGPLNAGP